jgi:hypothetical protein
VAGERQRAPTNDNAPRRTTPRLPHGVALRAMGIDFDNLPPVRAFGVWDAPMTDGAVWLDSPPTDMICTLCREAFKPDDNGAIMPTGFAQHRECGLRSVWGGIGHHVDHARYCKGELGTDAGLTYRQSALLVWRTFVDRRPVTEAELEELRGSK